MKTYRINISKMKDEFILDNVVMYIEGKKITENFNFNSIIDELKNLKKKGQSFIYVWLILQLQLY